MSVNGTYICVMDVAKKGGGIATTVEVTDKEGKCMDVLQTWGRNTKTECYTVQVDKVKDQDARFVTILAKYVIQPVIDNIVAGYNLKSMIMSPKEAHFENKTHQCDKCQKNVCI